MFYQISDTVKQIDLNDADGDYVTVGYVGCDEIAELGEKFNFNRSTIAACQAANKNFRSGVEVYDHYVFTELRIANPEDFGRFDCVALFIMNNLIIVVDVEDYDCSTKNKFMAAINRYAARNVTLEKVIYAFLDALISNDFKYIENTGNRITQLEEDVFTSNAGDNLHSELLRLKKELLTMHNYYEQLFDITEALEENENNLFDSEDLMYISNVANKIIRLREDTDSLASSVNHLQDAYSSLLDLKLNNTMKLFTVITSIFFPLTLIVGWYGMNFRAMPEFDWKYGYIYVILLSVFVLGVMLLLGKKKKWF